MTRWMSAKQARERFAEILGQVHFGKDTIIIEKQGKPMVAVIDVDWYERLLKAWDEPFRVLDRIRARNRGKRPEQIEKDIAGALAEVRAKGTPKARMRA